MLAPFSATQLSSGAKAQVFECFLARNVKGKFVQILCSGSVNVIMEEKNVCKNILRQCTNLQH